MNFDFDCAIIKVFLDIGTAISDQCAAVRLTAMIFDFEVEDNSPLNQLIKWAEPEESSRVRK